MGNGHIKGVGAPETSCGGQPECGRSKSMIEHNQSNSGQLDDSLGSSPTQSRLTGTAGNSAGDFRQN